MIREHLENRSPQRRSLGGLQIFATSPILLEIAPLFVLTVFHGRWQPLLAIA